MPPNKSKTDVILEKLDQLQREVKEIDGKVDGLNIHIKGNGGKGLHQRVDDLEKWKGGRPAMCPVDSEGMHRKRMWEIALIGLVVSIVAVVAGFVSRLVGG